MTRPTDNPQDSRTACEQLNASDVLYRISSPSRRPCPECADLGDLKGSGLFCFACGQGDR
jgi:hypothetical protein